MLYRRDPEQGRARFFSLMIERDLFGTIRLVRNWGPIGSRGREQVEIFPDEIETAQALGTWAIAEGRKATRILNRHRSCFDQSTLPLRGFPRKWDDNIKSIGQP